MRRRVIKWYYHRQYLKAYRILEELAKRHKDAGHEVHLNATNESNISLYCYQCPELQPLKRDGDNVVHAYRDRFGRDYT